MFGIWMNCNEMIIEVLGTRAFDECTIKAGFEASGVFLSSS